MDRYPYTNFHELNLEWFLKHFEEIFRQWDELYNTMLSWKAATDEELATWKVDTLHDLDQWKEALTYQWAVWQNSTMADLEAWETSTLAALDAWKDAFETLFNETFSDLSDIKTDAEAARDAAIAASNTAVQAAEDLSSAVAQVSANTADITQLKADRDRMDENVKTMLLDGTGEVPITGLTWINGRYVTPGAQIGHPSSHAQTITTTTAIPYSELNYSFILKEGYQVSFPTFVEGVLTEAPNAFITQVGVITSEQVKSNVDHMGDSFAIMLRTNPQQAISPNIDISEALTIQYSSPDYMAEIERVEGEIEDMMLTQALPNDIWTRGRYYTNGQEIGQPQSVTNAFCTLIDFDYNEVYSVTIKSGYKAAFPTFTDGAVLHTAQAYLTGTVSIEDIKNNVSSIGETFAIQIHASDDSAIPDGVDTDFIIMERPVIVNDYNLSADLKNYVLPKYGTSTWVAIGDSITDGRYSYIGSDQEVHTGTSHPRCYAMVASKILCFDPVVEYGYGGMGWLHVANDGTYLTDILNDMDLGTPDVITVMLGVNDRSTTETLGDHNSTSNDGSISGAIRYCIETLCSKYKDAQVIMITPLNASDHGNRASGYSKRWPNLNNLDSISELIKYWSEWYAVKCIDALNECPINVYNIQDMMLDGVHPTIAAHRKIGKWLAAELGRVDK